MMTNALAYTFSHTQAKRILYYLKSGPQPYEQLRERVGASPTEFHRLTRKLALLDAVRLRAPHGSEFEERRVRLVVEVSPKGRKLLTVLNKLDEVVEANEGLLGRQVVQQLRATP